MEIEFIKSSTKSDSKFVGLKINDEKVLVYYPEFLDIHSLKYNVNEKAKFLIDLIFENSIQEDSLANKEINGKLTVGENLFYSYFWLIQHKYHDIDLRATIKVTKNNQNGRINWRKTLKSSFTIYDNTIYYLNIFSDNTFKVEDELVKIYKYCLFKSIKKLGWLFNITISQNNNLKIRTNEALGILSKYLKNTNNESDRILLFHLITIIGEESNSENLNFTLFGTYNFEVIYEAMIFKSFSNVYRIQEYYPSSKWDLCGNEYKSSNLRPDAIYIYHEKVILLDAKYYRYCITRKVEDLPKTESLQKQLTYKDHIENRVGLEVQFNVYILPMLGDDSTSNFEYLGFTSSSWSCNTNIVYAIAVNFNKLCIDIIENKNGSQKLINELLILLGNIKTDNLRY